ncbi:hypothetical protein Sste5346_007954 [Sporothrix stenoceras]|uniref:C6 zinc finger domain containing protein n=1 Tax=Sporothrix stenoceras TaxID=5173 RepID=A0ABR3YS96_9PEZI
MSLISPAPWPRERDLGQDYGPDLGQGPISRSTTVWPRNARRTKSCTECQRRKQKTVDLHQYNTAATSVVPSPWLLAGPLDAMIGLPIVVNKQNAMLIHTFGEVLYHLKGSFDGVPDHDNPFLSHYVPWCVQSPLLVQTSLYISAQPLAERHFLDETTTMRIKVNAIHTLNEYLRSTDAATCAGDEAMGAVAQFISIEFYYGTPQAMQAHLQGLRQMVQMRGGFADTQVGALVTKVALVGDAIIAIAMEAEPILQKVTDSFTYVYDELPPPTFNLSYSSPLLAPRLPFGFCVSALGLHPATAWLLDEMVFLINAVLDLPVTPSEDELASLRSTAAWILERIEQLPVDSPDAVVPATSAAGSTINRGTEETTASTDSQRASPTDKEPPKPHSLLPRYPKFSSDRPLPPVSSSPTQDESEASTTTSSRQPLASQHPPAAPLYTAVRLTASLYTRAILERRPLSEVCTDEDALAILAASWRVPLDRWRGVVGVFLFIMVAIVPTLHQRSDAAGGGGIYSHIHTRFAKSILQIGLMNVALVDWPACREMMSRALRLQRWLRGGEVSN